MNASGSHPTIVTGPLPPPAPSHRTLFALAENSSLSNVPSMNTDRIRQKLTQGFRPFAIETRGGKRYAIPHPEFIMVGKGVVAVLGKDDSVTTIDALHIVALEDLPKPRPSKKP